MNNRGNPSSLTSAASAIVTTRNDEIGNPMSPKTNDVIEDGVPCKRIAGEYWFQYDVAAGYAGCTKGTIANMVYAGRIRSIKRGRYAYASKRDLDKDLLGTRVA